MSPPTAGPGALARPARLMLSRCGPAPLPDLALLRPRGRGRGARLRYSYRKATRSYVPSLPFVLPVQALTAKLD